MRYLILFILGFTTLLFAGCSDENSNAVLGAHPDNWYDDHPGNIAPTIESFIAECGGCHGLDLMGSGGAPSCFSASFNGSSCHAGGPLPHPLDGSFLDADSHGPVAKADLTVCQACHSDNPTGGPGSNPRFNVGIDSQGSIGCEACHTPLYAHPSTWAGPDNDYYHYSAGNIQQACTLCHGAALDGVGGVASSCLDCHAEVVNFTLDCTSCHGLPPTLSHATINATGPTVTDISEHDVCLKCHGMKESATGGTFSNVANYALFDKQTDTIGDHWNNFINMNSDTGYNEITGGCDNAGCHGGVAPFSLPDSGYPVKLGAYGEGDTLHEVGQDWLLPSGHVAAADPACVSCHTQTGGGQDPACQDCHVQGDPLVLLDCTSCHAEPPDNASTLESERPNREGAHNGHDGFTASTQDCSACHQGGGTGELSHYDRLSDGTTPNYPADVVLAAGFNSNSHGAATYNYGGGTCSGVNCHGGLTTPVWLTGSLDVDSQCENCHTQGTSEANSYNSGEHDRHVVDYGYDCIVCHNTTKLATSHFTNLANPAQWLDTAGATVDGTSTGILGDPDGIVEGNYDEGTMACLPTCHGTETW